MTVMTVTVSSVSSQGIESIRSLESQQEGGNMIHRSSHSPSALTSQIKGNVFLQSLEKMYRKSMEYISSMSSNKNGISRQVYEMIDIVSDVAMLTLVGIPILGLVAMSATALSPLLGSKVGRKKRETETGREDFLQKAGRSLLYARNLYDVLEKLEENFHKYGITSNDCQLKAICEVHRLVDWLFS